MNLGEIANGSNAGICCSIIIALTVILIFLGGIYLREENILAKKTLKRVIGGTFAIGVAVAAACAAAGQHQGLFTGGNDSNDMAISIVETTKINLGDVNKTIGAINSLPNIIKIHDSKEYLCDIYSAKGTRIEICKEYDDKGPIVTMTVGKQKLYLQSTFEEATAAIEKMAQKKKSKNFTCQKFALDGCKEIILRESEGTIYIVCESGSTAQKITEIAV